MTSLGFPPLLLSEPAAAHYLSVSPSKLRELKIPRKMLGGKRLYHRCDLDAYADALTYEGDGADEAECDRAFGV